MDVMVAGNYPARLHIDYPEGERDRLTTFFRLLLVIPIAVIMALISPEAMSAEGTNWTFICGCGGFLFLPLVLMILFRQKYPHWWFDWNLAMVRFSTRVASYFALLMDDYPSTDEEQAVHLDIVYPDAQQDLNRWMPLVKWFLAIPHYIALFFLGIVAVVVLILAWFSIVFTGRCPREWFDLIVGVERWYLRVVAYAFLLVTDEYPPFRLDD
jgi:hypothetical protein